MYARGFNDFPSTEDENIKSKATEFWPSFDDEPIKFQAVSTDFKTIPTEIKQFINPVEFSKNDSSTKIQYFWETTVSSTISPIQSSKLNNTNESTNTSLIGLTTNKSKISNNLQESFKQFDELYGKNGGKNNLF